jgi:hypothetical protein
MDIESQDGVLAPGALKPSNLSLQLELRRWGFPGLLVFLRPLGVFWCRLRGLLLMLRLGGKRPLVTSKALLFGVRLGRG